MCTSDLFTLSCKNELVSSGFVFVGMSKLLLCFKITQCFYCQFVFKWHSSLFGANCLLVWVLALIYRVQFIELIWYKFVLNVILFKDSPAVLVCVFQRPSARDNKVNAIIFMCLILWQNCTRMYRKMRLKVWL